MTYYVDVHTHLTHQKFATDYVDVIARAKQRGLGAIVVNGLEPISNRQILTMAEEYPVVKPALGIYPIDAVNDLLPTDFTIPVKKFNVAAEIAFIAECAEKNKLAAIGECGLDGHWLPTETFAAQEHVLEQLIAIANAHDLPIIVHSRKLEARTIEVLLHNQAKRVNFHCFGGKFKLAAAACEQAHWYFSIPTNARRSESFTKMLKSLPIERLLTETDAPFLSGTPGTRSEPADVVDTVNYLATLRGIDPNTARDQVCQNFETLFALKR